MKTIEIQKCVPLPFVLACLFLQISYSWGPWAIWYCDKIVMDAATVFVSSFCLVGALKWMGFLPAFSAFGWYINLTPPIKEGYQCLGKYG